MAKKLVSPLAVTHSRHLGKSAPVMSPPSAEQYPYWEGSAEDGMPCSIASCRAPHAVEVLHGVDPALLALGKENMQLESEYLMLSDRLDNTVSQRTRHAAYVNAVRSGGASYIETRIGHSRRR